VVEKANDKPYNRGLRLNNKLSVLSGHNSTVECQLPKLGVAGSNPVARSMGTVSGPSPRFFTLVFSWHCGHNESGRADEHDLAIDR
jgi:hypothetical protein